MQNPLLLFFFFIITAANLLSPSLSEPLDTQGLIDAICWATSDRTFCHYTLERHVDSPKIGLAALTGITMGAAWTSAKFTLKFIQNSNALDKNPGMKQYYTTCEKSYKGVMSYLAAAKQNADRRNYKSMFSNLQLSGSPLIYCENAMVYAKLPDIAERNRWMRILQRMGLNEGAMLVKY